MSDSTFDTALIAAAFRLAAQDGWRRVTVTAACRAAGLPLDQARVRFPSRAVILLRFGRLADQQALADAPSEGPVRDRLFDLLMRRFDALQAHRAGIKALLRGLPFDPATALMLACADRTSMRWMLEAAGIDATGPRGSLYVRGLMAVWLWCVRAWEKDESEDLSGTMAAVDDALGQAERAANWLCGAKPAGPPPPPANPGAGELDPSDPPPEPTPPVVDPSSAATPPAPFDPSPILDPPPAPTGLPPAPFDPTPTSQPNAGV
jgi:AcrR family transcriptional regulator